jgi:alkylation response protein AidB-like acyl-CoA dehydrogenase
MSVELTISRRLVVDAVERLVAGVPGAAVAVAMAKAHAVETAVAATGAAVQLHGGIGCTWGHGLHAYPKRAVLDRSPFGSQAAHRAALARRYAGDGAHGRVAPAAGK